MALMAQPMTNSNLHSAFSPYTDSPGSANPLSQQTSFGIVKRLSDSMDADSLVPPSPYPATVDPSPVDSNNSASTDATDIEVDERQETLESNSNEDILSPASNEDARSPASALQTPAKLNTQLPPRLMGNTEDGPSSVIHIPSGYKSFQRKSPPPSASSSSYRARSESSPSQVSEITISPKTPEKESVANRRSAQHTSPINTSIPPEVVNTFGQTPRASTRQEAEEEYKRKARSSKSLEDIAEAEDGERIEDTDDFTSEQFDNDDQTSMSSALESLNDAQEEISSLKNALSECWTLCNTLAGLSSNHRERMFSFAHSGDIQEQAWRSCWRLCQNLYDSRDDDTSKEITQTLELCREFCMALFEARQRTDESLDSVLRVSFELNNHLYNTHDRNLPLVFKERTLDFYVTMCHRLMKQRTSLPEETDMLLRSCWDLAENLFSLRQNTRDNLPADGTLLSSAVQACWDLCDLFREGWTQIRPDRGTPRPAPSRRSEQQREREHSDSRAPSAAGSSVSYAAQQMLPPSRPTSSMSHRNQTLAAQIRHFPPETPTTLFDETADSPATEPAVQNIMVLGYSDRHSPPQPRHWSSSASQSSQRSSSTTSTATASVSGAPQRASYTDPNAEPYLPRLKALVLKAAMNAGYNRASPQPLQSFVKSMSGNAFGAEPWRKDVLEQYRRLVLGDPSFRPGAGLPSGRKTAAELARAVQWLAKREEFEWLRNLFRIVFGFQPEDAPSKNKIWIQT